MNQWCSQDSLTGEIHTQELIVAPSPGGKTLNALVHNAPIVHISNARILLEQKTSGWGPRNEQSCMFVRVVDGFYLHFSLWRLHNGR